MDSGSKCIEDFVPIQNPADPLVGSNNISLLGYINAVPPPAIISKGIFLFANLTRNLSEHVQMLP